jgi:hypothetical protein
MSTRGSLPVSLQGQRQPTPEGKESAGHGKGVAKNVPKGITLFGTLAKSLKMP